MSVTRGDYKTAVQMKGFDMVDDSTILDEAVAAARRDVVAERRWSWLQVLGNTTLNLAAGVSSVATSTITDLLYIDAVRIETGNTGYDLTPLPLEAIRTYQNAYRWSAVPENWASVDGASPNAIFFWPRPDVPYTVVLDYVKSLEDLTDDNDADTVIPGGLKDAVVWKACWHLAFRMNDPARMQLSEAAYQQTIRKHVAQQAIGQRQGGSQVGSSGQWDYYYGMG